MTSVREYKGSYPIAEVAAHYGVSRDVAYGIAGGILDGYRGRKPSVWYERACSEARRTTTHLNGLYADLAFFVRRHVSAGVVK